MGDRLETADKAAERLTLLRVGHRQIEAGPCHAVQLRGNEQLPFLNRSGVQPDRIASLRQFRHDIGLRRRKAGEPVCPVIAVDGGDSPTINAKSITIERHHHIGICAEMHELVRGGRGIGQCERDNRIARCQLVEPLASGRIAAIADQAHRDERFGERHACHNTSRLLHEQDGFEHAEGAHVRARRPHREGTHFSQASGQLAIHAMRQLFARA